MTIAISANRFAGTWQITQQDDVYVEDHRTIAFEERDSGGKFKIDSHLLGEIDYRLGTRCGRDFIERSWRAVQGIRNPVSGRGWAVLRRGKMHGMIFPFGDDEIGFVANYLHEGTIDRSLGCCPIYLK